MIRRSQRYASRKTSTILLIACTSALVLAPALLAQTTGRIEGRATNGTGEPLRGATVTVAGPSLQGERSAVTEDDGRFRLPALPPGDYTVAAELQGFNPVEVTDVRVTLDRTVSLALELSAGFGDEISVSGLAPVLDRRSTTTGAEFPAEVFVDLPLNRTYVDLAFLAPGVAGVAGEGTNAPGLATSPSIRGASGAANRYIVDGLDVTDVGFGTLSSELPFEFIQEVEVKTGAYQPEYGGALGGVVNVITKSGGNETRGDLFGYFTDDGLQASAPPTQELGRFLGESEHDFGVDLGGKLVRDRLWYFAALNSTDREEEVTNRQDILYRLKTERLRWAGKLSWQVDPGRHFVASLFGEERDGPLFFETLNSAGRVANETDSSARSVALAYSSMLARRLLLEVNAGRFEEPFTFAAIDDGSPLYTDLTGTGFWARQQSCGDPELLNASGIQFAVGCAGGVSVGGFDPSRDELRGSLSRFANRHEIKVGIDHRVPRFDEFIRPPAPFGGPLVDAGGVVVAADGVAGSRFLLLPDSYILIETFQDARGETEELALFFQDQWRATPHLTFNLGVRLDRFEAQGAFAERRLDFGFDDMIAPRLGFVWDAAENGRSKLYGHLGRFFESVPGAVNTRNLGIVEVNLYFFFYPEDGTLPGYENLGTFRFPFSFGVEELVDPAIEPMHTDEYVLGFAYEVRPALAVGVAAVYRKLQNVIENISLDGGGSFFLTNPGGSYRTDPATGGPLPQPVVFPRPEREYRALELTLNKRLTRDWQLFASYVYSENEGNYAGLGESAHFTMQFDLPESLVGALGPLPNDRTHHFKVYGSYLWRFGLVTGFAAESVSGTPVSRLGFFENGRGGRFVTPRGSAGRTPDLRHLDLRLSYPLELRGGLELELIADVFNLTNEQRATSVDQIWTFALAEATLDPGECGGPGTGAGTGCPAGNPLWGTAEAFQPPRSLRVGLKLSW